MGGLAMASFTGYIEALHQRLEKARQLVADGKVQPIIGHDKHYVVQASRGGVYVVNSECPCPDAQQRTDVHRGWCKHKLAVELVKENAVDASRCADKRAA
jgi:hypothetical protein